MLRNYQKYALYCRVVTWISYSALLLILVMNTVIWPSCNRSPNIVILAIQVLILLVFLPGMLKQNVRSFVWLTFVLLGFFMAAVSTAVACYSLLTIVEVFFIVVLFIAAMLFVRWRSMELKQR